MKQTNNAIKFLMAQYRAIFKNAYFKGLTSAVLLTAGLAVAGGAQAATDITDKAGWEGLSGDITFNGTGTADPEYGNLKIDATSAAIDANNPNTVNITITSGATTANYIKGASSNAANVKGDNVSITLNLDNATNGLAISGAASSGVATLDIGKFAVTKGTLELTGAAAGDAGAATLKADTIVLGAANASDAKITFATGNTAAGFAVLEGRLTNEGTGTGTLDFTGFGTLKTYTDETGVDVDITVAATKGATLDLTDQSGDTFKVKSGKFDIKGGSASGSFTVSNGTLDIGDAVVLTNSETSTTTAVGSLVASGTSADAAVIRMSSKQLNSFLAADKGIDESLGTADYNGAVDLTKGTLELTDEADLGDFTFSTTAGTSGSVNLGSSLGDSIIKGTTLSITSQVANTDNLTVQANTLKLTELDDTTNQLFKGKTIAANYDVTLNKTAASDGTAADNAYTVSHEMGWLSTTEVTNPYHVANNKPADPEKITVAANGTIGHDYIVTSGAGDQGNFHIIGGHYTDANDIELKNGGKLTVGGAATGEQGVGIDASLTLTSAGSLTLNNSGSSATNEIEIAGNASGDKWHDDSVDANDVQFVPESVLDLSQGTIKFAYDDHADPASGKTYQVQTNITVGEGGELIVRDDQMNYLLNNLRTLEQRNDAVSGAAINLSGGTVTVKGDLELDISKISPTADTSDTINFENGGYLVADNIVLEEKETETTGTYTDSGTPLNLGAEGHLVAETITLNNRNINSNNTGFVDYQVTAGTLQVGSALSSVNSTVVFGDGSTGGASLTLGYIDPNYDEYRIRKDGTYNLSAETGTVQPNLKLNGAASDPNKTALTVNYGAWTLKNNLEASNATITVGSNGYERDANGDLYTASLTGQGLTLHNGTNMIVNSNAEVTFDTFKMDGSTAQVHVNNTTMTINGKHTEATSTVEESWGLEVTGGTVTVDGREGVLAIGADALSSVKATKGTDGKFTLANDLPVSGFVTLDNWATLSLELDSNDVFGEESLVALRKAFLSNTYSVNGAPVDKGYIDIGAARIDGITVTNGEVSWNEMQKYKDIIATLVDVTSATNVQANVGNVKADGNTQVVNFNDTSLRAGANGFVKNKNGENIDANVNAGSRLGLYNGGSIENVTLEAGNNTIGTTELSVVSSAAEGATEPETTIASVDGKGHDYTSFVVQGNTTVNGKVDVGELVVDKALTIKGEAYAESGLYSSETTGTDGTVSLVNTGALTVNTLEVRGGAEYAGSITATGAVEFGSEAENPMSPSITTLT